MDKPVLARYMCLETHDNYQQGVIYTVEEHGMIDFGLDYRDWKINGKSIDVTKFDRVHHNIPQLRP
jgi:hypothetical protein